MTFISGDEVKNSNPAQCVKMQQRPDSNQSKRGFIVLHSPEEKSQRLAGCFLTFLFEQLNTQCKVKESFCCINFNNSLKKAVKKEIKSKLTQTKHATYYF